MKRVATLLTLALSVVIIGAVTLPAVAANNGKQTQTPQQKLAAWLANPPKTINWANTGEMLLRDLSIKQGEKVLAVIKKNYTPRNAGYASMELASHLSTYKEAVAYYKNAMQTPQGVSNKQKISWANARDGKLYPLLLLRHFATTLEKTKPGSVATEFNRINPNLEYVGRYAYWAIKYLPKDQAAKLVVAGVKKYGTSPTYAKRIKLWKHLITCIGNGTISQADAKSMVFVVKLKVMNKLAKTDSSDKGYAALKQYASQVATLYDQLK